MKKDKQQDEVSVPKNVLKEMGIKNPAEIFRYSLVQVDNEDILKVYYKRNNRSFRASSRKFKFGRSPKTIVTDSGKPEYEAVYETSPFLEKAIQELDKIIAKSQDITDRKKNIIDEIDYLEKEVGSKLKELRYQVEQLKCINS